MQPDERLIQIVPSERQLKLMNLEFYAFVHFTVNTFTDREWGDGTEDERVFAPTALDARQWVAEIKNAGMKGLILTCKHHDGFCLWPSAYTTHTVAASPFRNGKGDVVREVSDACHEAGIAFGVYLSPWDRNSRLYGQGQAYDDYFVSQLTELLTQYGEIFAVWFDGACGEGPNGKRQAYDWERYYAAIRRLQPNACISVCGPDVRWCGNEAGDTRAAEWSVVPSRMTDTEKIAAKSQQADEVEFRARTIRAQDQDLGSRAALADESKLIWYPAEVNTSIRPGWFYHAAEDDKVRPLDELLHIYEHSIGGNATFLLNIPPTREGLLHTNDVRRLRELGAYLRAAFADNLLTNASLTANAEESGHGVDNVRTDSYDTYFKPADGVCAVELVADWREPKPLRCLVMKENVRLSQRVERYAVDVMLDGAWRELSQGSVIGYKRIVSLKGVTATAVRIRILDARVAPTLSFVGVYA